MADEIRFGSDGAAGLLLKPPKAAPSGSSPAVVLLPAIAGVNDYIGRVGATLAERGYGVLALDYFAREGKAPDLSSPEKSMSAVAALSDEQVVADVDAALVRLSEEEGIDDSRVAVLGFCIGGSQAILSAARLGPRLKCAVAFYGVLRYGELTDNKPRSPIDAVEELEIPLLGHWGDADHLVPADDVAELRGRLSGKPAEIYLYPGAGHAFHEDFRDVYRPIAAADAWERSLAYLGWYLRSGASS